MNDFGGFDWNGNGHRDYTDDYMDYKVSGSDGSGGSHSTGSYGKKSSETPGMNEIIMTFIAFIICVAGWFLAIDFLTDYPFIGMLVCIGAIVASLKVYAKRKK